MPQPPTPTDKFIYFLARIGARMVLIMSWLKIVVSPVIGFTMLGGLAFLYFDQSTLGTVLWAAIVGAGLVLGIWWAEHERKTMGLVQFHTKLIATPEFDKPDRPDNPQ
jgi:hypothetical protein